MNYIHQGLLILPELIENDLIHVISDKTKFLWLLTQFVKEINPGGNDDSY